MQQPATHACVRRKPEQEVLVANGDVRASRHGSRERDKAEAASPFILRTKDSKHRDLGHHLGVEPFTSERREGLISHGLATSSSCPALQSCCLSRREQLWDCHYPFQTTRPARLRLNPQIQEIPTPPFVANSRRSRTARPNLAAVIRQGNRWSC